MYYSGSFLQARVEVDYAAQRSDELPLTKGALVKIVLKDNDMWWLGEVGRKQGYVPSKCLQVISGEYSPRSTHFQQISKLI